MPMATRRPLRAAILAASPHDTQPWLFAVSGSVVAVHADRSRHLGTFDPFRREMHLGVGCAIENFVCAANAFGIPPMCSQRTAGWNCRQRQSLHWRRGSRSALAGRRPMSLFDAIPNRHTNRGPYRQVAIARERLDALVDLVAGPDVRVVFVSDRSARRELGAMIVAATERIIADPEMSMDSFRWIRTGRRDVLAHRDGVTIDTSGTGTLMTIAGKMAPDLGAATTDRIWLKMTRDVHTATAPAFGMILVRDRLDMASAISAGRAWQRLHLVLTAQGLAAQPLNQPVEMIDRHQMLGRNDDFRPALAALARAKGWEPTFVFRLGYARREAPRSPRRPLSDVVKHEA